MEDSFGKGYLSKKLNGMMVWQFLESKLLTPVLKELITKSAMPLRAIERTFAPDSTGFASSRFTRWTDIKYGGVRTGRDWVKAHCIASTRFHVITACEILDKDAADCPQFKPLVQTTAESFRVEEVVADKAYLSRENLEQVDALGATPYIPFKINSVPAEAGDLWERMYHFFAMHREEWDKRYHQRSQAESAFSGCKAKFGRSVRSRTDVAMANEVFCKVIAWNICRVIMAQVELGIDVQFWGPHYTDADGNPLPDAAPAQPVDATAEQPAPAAFGGTFTAGWGV